MELHKLSSLSCINYTLFSYQQFEERVCYHL